MAQPSLATEVHLSRTWPEPWISSRPWLLVLLRLHVTQHLTMTSCPPNTASHVLSSVSTPGRNGGRSSSIKYVYLDKERHAPLTLPWQRGHPSRANAITMPCCRQYYTTSLWQTGTPSHCLITVWQDSRITPPITCNISDVIDTKTCHVIMRIAQHTC